MYDFEWHKAHAEETARSAGRVIDVLSGFCDLGSVLDVGCGDGQWLRAYGAAGAARLQGIDGPWTDLERLLIPAGQVKIHDLSNPFDLGERFDLAMSSEVAEHVAGRHAETFVKNLTRHADVVLFGAAIPYQGGFRHINERWQSYWAGLFAAEGYGVHDPVRPRIWDEAGVSVWYKQNLLVYVNSARTDLVERLAAHMAATATSPMPLDVVHPRQFEAIASYSQIAFKPLIRKLPRQAARKLGQVLGGKL